jgi:hypothetical protein
LAISGEKARKLTLFPGAHAPPDQYCCRNPLPQDYCQKASSLAPRFFAVDADFQL